MQHYGIPTRLLDWTENPFIGLYFAVISSPFTGKITSGKPVLSFSSDAAVWVLDPVAWNRRALKHQGYDRGVLMPIDEALQGYKPLTQFGEMNVQPVALYGAHEHPRRVWRRGESSQCSARVQKGMEETYASDLFPDNCLMKIVLDRDKLPAMRASILNNGITESVVFPDLEGLAREIKRDFQFDYSHAGKTTTLEVEQMEAHTLTWWRNRQGKIDMEPTYQRRGRLWSPADKAYLIDSILNGFDVPKVYMADFTWGDSPLNRQKMPYAIIDKATLGVDLRFL